MDKRRYPRLSLDLLRGFRVAARHLSFTRAAQELFVTQSAISREIRTLEEQIGQPLFHRVHRALQLTRAGKELYLATDAALSGLDAAIDRLAGSGRALAVTTTNALASLWLAPRLPRFNRLHPEIGVRVAASNEEVDLERDQLDVAIQFASAGAETPPGERLFGCETFPVCTPALARDAKRGLRTAADLAHHVRLDFETVREGRWFSEWDFWFDAMGIPAVTPASTLRFSQFEQVLPAAIEGNGVAIGALPHFVQQLRDGVLCAPLGREAIANRGTFFIVLRRDVAERDAVKEFVAWLRSEVRRDGELTLAPTRDADRSPARRAQASGARARGRRP
jgi:DNA-binding transcriptional LysR family regulator